MPHISERVFWISGVTLVIGLAALDGGFGGRDRLPFVGLFIVGTLVLWWLSRR